ncbi:MAG: YgjV family protein [Spirochaetales bacterium]
MFIASQIIGVFIIILSIISLIFKNKDKLLLYQTIAAVGKVAAILLVGGWSGAINQIVGLIRKYWFYINAKKGRANGLWLLMLFSFAAIIVTIFTWEGYISLLPMVSIIGVTYGLWQNNIFVLRYCLMIGNIGYSIYGIVVGAYTTATNEIILLVATIISLIALYINDYKKKKIT